MMYAILTVALLICLDILLRIPFPDEQQPGPVDDPAPAPNEEEDLLPFGPAPRDTDH